MPLSWVVSFAGRKASPQLLPKVKAKTLCSFQTFSGVGEGWPHPQDTWGLPQPPRGLCMLSGQAYVLGSSHGSAGWRPESLSTEGMGSPTLGHDGQGWVGERTAPTPPGKKGPQDLRPIPVSVIGFSGVCLGRGAWVPWFIFTIGSVSAYVLVPG